MRRGETQNGQHWKPLVSSGFEEEVGGQTQNMRDQPGLAIRFKDTQCPALVEKEQKK
jgi:hypothetical protein